MKGAERKSLISVRTTCRVAQSRADKEVILLITSRDRGNPQLWPREISRGRAAARALRARNPSDRVVPKAEFGRDRDLRDARHHGEPVAGACRQHPRGA